MGKILSHRHTPAWKQMRAFPFWHLPSLLLIRAPSSAPSSPSRPLRICTCRFLFYFILVLSHLRPFLQVSFLRSLLLLDSAIYRDSFCPQKQSYLSTYHLPTVIFSIASSPLHAKSFGFCPVCLISYLASTRYLICFLATLRPSTVLFLFL